MAQVYPSSIVLLTSNNTHLAHRMPYLAISKQNLVICRNEAFCSTLTIPAHATHLCLTTARAGIWADFRRTSALVALLSPSFVLVEHVRYGLSTYDDANIRKKGRGGSPSLRLVLLFSVSR